MLARMRRGIGGITGIAMMVLAIFIWTRSADLSSVLATRPLHPSWEILAVRCAALATAAGAQLLILGGIVANQFERRAGDELLRIIFGLLGSAALISALSMGWAGR